MPLIIFPVSYRRATTIKHSEPPAVSLVVSFGSYDRSKNVQFADAMNPPGVAALPGCGNRRNSPYPIVSAATAA